jgi:general secretion pathway protein B
MSFILDALRKSEHERQRQTGPALVEVAVAAPKSQTNRWATAAIALLLVNLVAIGVLLLVKSRDEPAAAPVAQVPASATAPAPTATAPPARVAAPAAQASVTQTLPEPQVATAPPMLRPAEAPPGGGTRNPLEQEMPAYSPTMEYEAAAAAAAPPPGPPAVTPIRRGGSVVYQTLPEAEPAATYQPAPGGSTGHLPQADDMTARGALPEMRLELHVWSTKPQERFVFVNGRRYREGETTAEGAAVEEITRDGVIMNSGGNRFLLSRD